MSSKAKVSFKSPIGELRWVYINEGGVDTSFAKDGSKVQKVANVVLNEEDAQEAIDQLNKIWEELRANAGIKVLKPKSLGIKYYKDPETQEPTGEVGFCFKTNAYLPDGKDSPVVIFNAKGDKVSLGDKKIGNGSIGIVHGEAALYEFKGTYGITLYLKAIQIVKLVEFTGSEVQPEDLTIQYPDAYGETFEGVVEERVADVTAEATAPKVKL